MSKVGRTRFVQNHFDAWHEDSINARRAALEQAAKVCDRFAVELRGDTESPTGWAVAQVALECSTRIRALLEPSDER